MLVLATSSLSALARVMQNASLKTLPSTPAMGGLMMRGLGEPFRGNPMRVPSASTTTGNLSCAPANERRSQRLRLLARLKQGDGTCTLTTQAV